MNTDEANPHGELEERLRFETLIADLSSKFVNLPPGEVDSEVMDAERRLCEVLGLDISAIWQWSAGPPGCFTLTHYYSAQDGPQPSMSLNDTDFPWFRQLMIEDRTVPISSMDEMPAQAALDRENCRRLGVKSNLCLPLTVGGKPVGILGLNTIRAERDWPEALVKRLQLVAQIFANALARKRADEALREREEQLSLAVSSAQAGIWMLDCRSGLFWAAAEARVLFGFSPEEVVQMDRFKEAVHPGDWDLVQRSLDRSVKEGEPVNVEYRIRLVDGRTRWIASRGRPHFASNGEPERLMGISMDITDRKRADEAFRRSEARLAAGTELAGLGYYEVDYAERTCFLDDRFREICGVPPGVQQSLDPVQFWLEHVHPDDRQYLSDERQKLHNGKLDRIAAEYRYLHPGDGLRWLHHSACVTRRSAGEAGIRTFGVIRDVTPHKRAEMEIQELRNNLTHADRVTMLGQLASALAHELSQPLGAILRNAEAAEIMLGDPSPDLEELRAIVTDILKDDHRAGDVIDRLRSLLKRRSLDFQPIELPALVAEVLSLLRGDAAARHVAISNVLAAGLPAIRGDRIHLQQVLLNLLLNAMDALEGATTRERHVRITAHLNNSDMVEVRIADNGPGIPADSFDRLFQPFFTTKAKGTGIGLPVSKTIIEAHKGRIWAENRQEGGACFCFTLTVATRME